MSAEIVTGYYRYTDIWFEWTTALSEKFPEEAPYVKAMIAHDALVHPTNPLHPGVAEAELYMGILQNGESRLMFSSKQIDYICYWLYAMKIIDKRVALPFSNCLLLRSDLKTISPVYYKTGGDLKIALKQIEKNNKRIRKGASLSITLEARRVAFEKVRTLWNEKKGVWLAIDLEAWEYEHDLITELGLSAIRWEDGKEIIEDRHYMISADLYRNGKWVADNRTKYDFGTSSVIKRKEFEAVIAETLEQYGRYGAVFLIFHDANQDLKYLRQLNAPLKTLSLILPDKTPKEGLFIADTSELFAALLGEESSNKRGLEQMCHHLSIKTSHLHNAGNDAHYTLEALKVMASGAPLDAQREERWPAHTGKRGGVQVEFTEEEEEVSDDDLYYA